LPAGRPARLTCTCRACARMHACMICVISMCRRPEREEDYTSCTTIPALLTQRRKMNLLTHNQLRTRRRPVRCMDWPERAAPPPCLVVMRTCRAGRPVHARHALAGGGHARRRASARPPRLCVRASNAASYRGTRQPPVPDTHCTRLALCARRQ
jgi:hypothetical protein